MPRDRHVNANGLWVPESLLTECYPEVAEEEARARFRDLVSLLQSFSAEDWLFAMSCWDMSEAQQLSPVQASILNRETQFFGAHQPTMLGVAHLALRCCYKDSTAEGSMAPSIDVLRRANGLYHASAYRHIRINKFSPLRGYCLMLPMMYEQMLLEANPMNALARVSLLHREFEAILINAIGLNLDEMLRVAFAIVVGSMKHGRGMEGKGPGIIRINHILRAPARKLTHEAVIRFLRHLSTTPSEYNHKWYAGGPALDRHEMNALNRVPFIYYGRPDYIMTPFRVHSLRVMTRGLRDLLMGCIGHSDAARETFLTMYGHAFERYVRRLATDAVGHLEECKTHAPKKAGQTPRHAEFFFEAEGVACIVETKAGSFVTSAIRLGDENGIRTFLDRKIQRAIAQLQSSAKHIQKSENAWYGFIVTDEWVPMALFPMPLPPSICIMPVEEMECLLSLMPHQRMPEIRNYFAEGRPDWYFSRRFPAAENRLLSKEFHNIAVRLVEDR